ncbi:MAG: DM13 domain-containing protein [Alphaproteobacteria bacterium]|nr:DM13 domain-containing protein [Alphaproteobacteria bacterium]
MVKKAIQGALISTALLLAAVAASTAQAADGAAVASGTFVGQSGHAASGSVAVHKSGSGYTVVLGEDFVFDGAPDPKLGFGKNGYDSASKFSHLNANSGQQDYTIPAATDVAGYDEVWIWCEQYNVPLGVAKLN